MLSDDELRKALRRAFELGQTYWRQADSLSATQHRRSDETRARFNELVERTSDALADGVRVTVQPLTDAEILRISGNVQGGMRSNPVIEFARAIEQAHGIGNAGVRCAPTMTDEQAWALREHLPTSHETTGKQFFGAFARVVLAHVTGVPEVDRG